MPKHGSFTTSPFINEPYAHRCRACRFKRLCAFNSEAGNQAMVIVYSYFMPFCSIVKTVTPRCVVRSSTVPRGNSFDYTTNRHDITFYYPTHLMKHLATFLAWSCCRRCGFVAKQKISPNCSILNSNCFARSN